MPAQNGLKVIRDWRLLNIQTRSAPAADGLAPPADAETIDVAGRLLNPRAADHSFYEAIPGLLEALPSERRMAVERFRLAPAAGTLVALEPVVNGWSFDRLEAGIVLAPTIPVHCGDGFMLACRDLAHDGRGRGAYAPG